MRILLQDRQGVAREPIIVLQEVVVDMAMEMVEADEADSGPTDQDEDAEPVMDGGIKLKKNRNITGPKD